MGRSVRIKLVPIWVATLQGHEIAARRTLSITIKGISSESVKRQARTKLKEQAHSDLCIGMNEQTAVRKSHAAL